MKIGVLGLGLIGGSIFKKLSTITKYDLIGVSSSVCLDNVSGDLRSLKSCDLVFVCTPMNKTLEILDQLDQILEPRTIVTDVCSLKKFVTLKKYNYNFIPSHPMAGTEFSGWENSFPELFVKAKWVITPIKGIVLQQQKVLESVIRDLGADVIVTTPEEHDYAVAMISHMPMLVAQAMCENIKDNKLAQQLAASGFRDTTRLALSNSEMANDMLKINREYIESTLTSMNKVLSDLIDSNNYYERAESIKFFRKNLCD